jgi:hypothetical protein
MLDVPCGDYHWMNEVDLGGVAYTGGDIVRELVDRNLVTHAREGVAFQYVDLVSGPLPRADLVFCRDCLVHFSFEDVLSAFETIRASGAKYLLTTTFVDREKNHDIPTGSWRPLNLEKPPFGLPAPLRLVDEECTEGGGVHRDKALGLWRVEDLPERSRSGGAPSRWSSTRFSVG